MVVAIAIILVALTGIVVSAVPVITDVSLSANRYIPALIIIMLTAV